MNIPTDMDIDQSSSSQDTPKLREGERVEVRQKDLGLRGSWHPATIVGLEPGHRLVEYNELLTDDGLCKLRESIPLAKCMEKPSPATVSTPQKNIALGPSMQSLHSKKRGLLRPSPPLCTEPSALTWKGGLFVDVFYQNAWWEAILLDDIISLADDAFIYVIYPDEGDLARVCAKDLRISQHWDEVTGRWSMKGSCNLSRVLKRRGIGRKEVILIRDTECNGNMADMHQNNSVQGEVKVCRTETDQVCPSLDAGLQGGNAAGGEFSQDMVYSIQGAVAAASAGKERSGDIELSHSHQHPLLDCLSNDHDINKEPLQLTCPESPIGLHSNCWLEVTSGSCRSEEATNEELGRTKLTDEDTKPCWDDIKTKGVGKDFLKSEDTRECTSAVVVKEEFINDGMDLESWRRNGEVYVSPCEREAESLVSHPVFAIPSPQDHPHGICELMPQELGFGMRRCFDRGDTAYSGTLHSRMHSDIGGENNTCLPTLSQKADMQQPVASKESETPRKEALTTSDRDSFDGEDRLEKGKNPAASRAVSKEQKLGLGKGTYPWKAQVDSDKTTSQEKTKAKDGTEEKVARTGQQKEDDIVFDSETKSRGETDTLRSFKDYLVLQKQADALKRKALKMGVMLERGEKNEKVSDMSRHYSEPGQAEAATASCELAPMGGDKSLKILARDVAKKALLEAGFTIKLRPRKSKDYQDAVYVSPEGHSYWSIPRAWQAFKQAQAEKPLEIDGQWSPKNASSVVGTHENGTQTFMHGERRQGLARADKSTIEHVFSWFGKDKRLESALKKLGSFSAQDVIRQAELTNAELTDVLLEDLGVLKKHANNFTESNTKDKIKRPNLKNAADSKTPKLALAYSVDERRGRKRKLDSESFSGKADRRMLRSRVSSTTKRLQGASLPKTEEDRMMLKQGTVRTLNQTPDVFKGAKKALVKPADSLLEAVAKKSRGNSKEVVLKKGVSRGNGTKVTVSRQKVSSKREKNSRAQSGFRLVVRPSSTSMDDGSEELSCHSKRTVFSWMIDRGAVLEKEKIFFVDGTNNQVLKEGVVTREGILCRCCKRVYTIHNFEAHGGSHFGEWQRNLVFASGRSLLDCQLEAWDAETLLRKTHNYAGVTADDTNDDTCLLCGDGGDLICCDHCPSTFHMSCLQIDNVPEGNWYCPKCCCGACGHSQPDEEEEELAMVLCSQCEHRYHIACLHGGHIMVGKQSFCGGPCEKIFSGLRKLIGTTHPLDGGFSWTLLRCMEEDEESQSSEMKVATEHHSKLAVALLVIKECFNPMDDPRTNIDMIAHALYNRWSEFDRLNYMGFYTAVLEREGEIISVASIRIHGVRLAEMPLIGTRQKYRRQGMCRLLVGVIEKLLHSLEVATFILPAIPELFETWTHAFGFRPLDISQRSENTDLSMMMFPGTELLQKPLLGSPTRDALVLQKPDSESELTRSENRSLDASQRSENTDLSMMMVLGTDLLQNNSLGSPRGGGSLVGEGTMRPIEVRDDKLQKPEPSAELCKLIQHR